MRAGNLPNGNEVTNKRASEFFQQFIAGKVSRREWEALPPDGDLDKLEQTDYLSFLRIESLINEAGESWGGKGTFRQEWTFINPGAVGTKTGDMSQAALVFTQYTTKMYEGIARRWNGNYRAELERAAAGREDGEITPSDKWLATTHQIERASLYGITGFAMAYMLHWGKETLLKNRAIDLREQKDRDKLISESVAYSGAGLAVTDTLGPLMGLRSYERTSSAIGAIVQTRAPGIGLMWDSAAGAVETGKLAFYAATDYNRRVEEETTAKGLRFLEGLAPLNPLYFRAFANQQLSQAQRRRKYLPDGDGAWEFLLKRAADRPSDLSPDSPARSKPLDYFLDPTINRIRERDNAPRGVAR